MVLEIGVFRNIQFVEIRNRHLRQIRLRQIRNTASRVIGKVSTTNRIFCYFCDNNFFLSSS